MLYHLGFSENATMIQNAWLKTLEDGIHTADIFNIENSKINFTLYVNNQ